MAEGIYKFLLAQHVSAVLEEGTVKIGSLSHYRGLEDQDQWIADKLEGRVVIEPGAITISEDDDKLTPLLPHSLRNHVRAESGGTITYAPGVKITIEHPDTFIFSAAMGDPALLKEAMCRDTEERYDACIGINSIEHLAHRMLFRGRALNLNNARMFQHFHGFKCSAVNYDTLSRTPELGRAPEASPFLKDKKFKAQSEYRIAFWPRQPVAQPTLLIRIPRPD